MKNEMTSPSMPWWRVPTMWLVVGGPALVVVAGIATLVIALRAGDRPLEELAGRGKALIAPMAPAMQARNHAAVPPPAR